MRCNHISIHPAPCDRLNTAAINKERRLLVHVERLWTQTPITTANGWMDFVLGLTAPINQSILTNTFTAYR